MTTAPPKQPGRSAVTSAAAPPGADRRVLLDTGVLIALYARDDPHHAAAMRWFNSFSGTLHTVEPVLTETAYFLPVRLRAVIAELAASNAITVHRPDAVGFARMAGLLRKYADIDADWADIALVWLAETMNIHRIATLDTTDFNVYCIHGRKRFALELLG